MLLVFLLLVAMLEGVSGYRGGSPRNAHTAVSNPLLLAELIS
jgi:hypothetical protein